MFVSFLLNNIVNATADKTRDVIATIAGNSGIVGVGFTVWVGFVVSVELGEGSAVGVALGLIVGFWGGFRD